MAATNTHSSHSLTFTQTHAHIHDRVQEVKQIILTVAVVHAFYLSFYNNIENDYVSVCVVCTRQVKAYQIRQWPIVFLVNGRFVMTMTSSCK